jgi:hypothetical protein
MIRANEHPCCRVDDSDILRRIPCAIGCLGEQLHLIAEWNDVEELEYTRLAGLGTNLSSARNIGNGNDSAAKYERSQEENGHNAQQVETSE